MILNAVIIALILSSVYTANLQQIFCNSVAKRVESVLQNTIVHFSILTLDILKMMSSQIVMT